MSPEIDINAEGCNCPEGQCLMFCEPAHICVNRLARKGRVHTEECKLCEAVTWHFEGKCLRCEHLKKEVGYGI